MSNDQWLNKLLAELLPPSDQHFDLYAEGGSMNQHHKAQSTQMALDSARLGTIINDLNNALQIMFGYAEFTLDEMPLNNVVRHHLQRAIEAREQTLASEQQLFLFQHQIEQDVVSPLLEVIQDTLANSPQDSETQQHLLQVVEAADRARDLLQQLRIIGQRLETTI